MSELELEVINLERDLSLETKVHDAHLWDLLPSAASPAPNLVASRHVQIP